MFKNHRIEIFFQARYYYTCQRRVISLILTDEDRIVILLKTSRWQLLMKTHFRIQLREATWRKTVESLNHSRKIGGFITKNHIAQFHSNHKIREIIISFFFVVHIIILIYMHMLLCFVAYCVCSMYPNW